MYCVHLNGGITQLLVLFLPDLIYHSITRINVVTVSFTKSTRIGKVIFGLFTSVTSCESRFS